MAIRAFAIRKARRYLKRDGEWLTEEATDDILDTIEESFGLRYCERSVLNWVAAWICTKIVRPKQQRPWANYKDKGWRKTPFAAEKRIERSLTANNGQRARHVRDMVWQNFGKVIHRRTAARELQRQGWVDKVTTTSSKRQNKMLQKLHWEVRKGYHPRQLFFADETHKRGRDVGKRRRGYGRHGKEAVVELSANLGRNWTILAVF